MRRPISSKHILLPDNVYASPRVAKFINVVMSSGKKETARKVVYGAFDIIKEKMGVADPIETFDLAIKNASPALEVRSRRIGGANYQVPREVRPERRQALAFRWILIAARGKKGAPMAQKLADELMLAAKGEGAAVKKKEDTHKMAESNKAFAHFAW